MLSELDRTYFKKGRLLRKRCGQLRVNEHYVRSELDCLNGRTLIPPPSSNSIVIPSFCCLQSAVEILAQLSAFVSQNNGVDSKFVYLQTILMMVLDGSSAKFQKSCKQLLFESASNNNLILFNETFTSSKENHVVDILEQTNESANKRVIRACRVLNGSEFNNDVLMLCLHEADPLFHRCIQSDIPVTTLTAFVAAKCPDLVDSVSDLLLAVVPVIQSLSSDPKLSHNQYLYEPHLLALKIEQGIKSQRLFAGVLTMYDHTNSEGEVVISLPSANDTATTTVLIRGSAHLNRALDGDRVAVQLLPESEWYSVAETLVHIPDESIPDAEGKDDVVILDEETVEEAVVENASSNNQVAPRIRMVTGKICGILQRSCREIVVTIPAGAEKSVAGSGSSFATSSREQFVLVIPVARNLPKLRLKTRQLLNVAGNRAIVSFHSWPRDSQYPNCHFLRILGDPSDWRTDVDALLCAHSIVPKPFTKRALQCLPVVPNSLAMERVLEQQRMDWRNKFSFKDSWVDSCWIIPDNLRVGRMDLRSTRRVFSVDPPGCQDIDDAMSVHWKEDEFGLSGAGKIEVCVMIADVCAFVSRNSALDIEAQTRGTTVYLPHVRFDMLPGLISSDIASLHGEKDRLAVATNWDLIVTHKDGRPILKSENPIELDENDDIVFTVPSGPASWMGRVLIRSVAAMTYDQAHNLVHDLPPDLEPCDVPPGQAGRPVDRKLWPSLKQDLRLLTAFSRHLKRQRILNGAIELHQSTGSELRFDIATSGEVAGMHGHAEIEIHNTIAELMILANSAVARTVLLCTPQEALVRVHPPALSKSLGDVIELLSLAGVQRTAVPTASDILSSSGENDQIGLAAGADILTAMRDVRGLLSKSLERAHNNQTNRRIANSADNFNAIVELVTSVLIRSMNEAKYTCSGSLSGNLRGVVAAASSLDDTIAAEGKMLGHTGLGLEFYTHFTSPIRRYADIIVHRQLLGILQSKRWIEPYKVQFTSTRDWIAKIATATTPSASLEVAIPKSLLPSVHDLGTKSVNPSQEAIAISAASDMTNALDPLLFPPAASKTKDVDELDDILGSNLCTSSVALEHDILDDLLSEGPLSSIDLAPTVSLGQSIDIDLDSLLTGMPPDSPRSGTLCGSTSAAGVDSDAALDLLLLSVESESCDAKQDYAAIDLMASVMQVETTDVSLVSPSQEVISNAGGDEIPYSSQQVAAIADHLNVMNRRSKRVQSDCQSLFMCLYFSQRTETHTAVIFALRENGVMVYIPTLEYKGPLYITDKSGIVCIDPTLVGEARSSGQDAPPQFPGRSIRDSSIVRALPKYRCHLITKQPIENAEDKFALSSKIEKNEVLVIEEMSETFSPTGEKLNRLQLRVMQQITVEVSCPPASNSTLRRSGLQLSLVSVAEKSLGSNQADMRQEIMTARSMASKMLESEKKSSVAKIATSSGQNASIKPTSMLIMPQKMPAKCANIKVDGVLVSNKRLLPLEEMIVSQQTNLQSVHHPRDVELPSSMNKRYQKSRAQEKVDARYAIANSGRIAFGPDEDIRPIFKMHRATNEDTTTPQGTGSISKQKVAKSIQISAATIEHAESSAARGRAVAMANMQAWGEEWPEEEELPDEPRNTEDNGGSRGVDGTSGIQSYGVGAYGKETSLAMARMQKLTVAKRRSKYDA